MIDNEKRVLGVITVDDIVDVINEEVEEDFFGLSEYEMDQLGHQSLKHLRKIVLAYCKFANCSNSITGYRTLSK